MRNEKITIWGVSSLTLSILSFFMFFMPYFGLPLSITSIVFSRIQSKHNPTGCGTAGLVIGIISTVINSVTLVLVGLAFLILGTTGLGL